MSREKLLHTHPDGSRLPLRDPKGLAKWLAGSLGEWREEGEETRSRGGRPKAFGLVKAESATRVSRSTLSKLLAPAIRTAARPQRYVTAGVLRRLARLPGGEKCLDFVLTPREREREAKYVAALSTPLSGPEVTLLREWLESRDGQQIRGCARRLSHRGFDRVEIINWLRWLLQPFASTGINAVVARAWSELTERERASYLSGCLRVVERILARRKPAKLQVLHGSKRIEWDGTMTRIAQGLGISQDSEELDLRTRPHPLTGVLRRAK